MNHGPRISEVLYLGVQSDRGWVLRVVLCEIHSMPRCAVKYAYRDTLFRRYQWITFAWSAKGWTDRELGLERNFEKYAKTCRYYQNNRLALLIIVVLMASAASPSLMGMCSI